MANVSHPCGRSIRGREDSGRGQTTERLVVHPSLKFSLMYGGQAREGFRPRSVLIYVSDR